MCITNFIFIGNDGCIKGGEEEQRNVESGRRSNAAHDSSGTINYMLLGAEEIAPAQQLAKYAILGVVGFWDITSMPAYFYVYI